MSVKLPLKFRWLVARNIRLKVPRYAVILNLPCHRKLGTEYVN